MDFLCLVALASDIVTVDWLLSEGTAASHSLVCSRSGLSIFMPILTDPHRLLLLLGNMGSYVDPSDNPCVSLVFVTGPC